MSEVNIEELNAKIKKESQFISDLKEEIHKHVVGQEYMISRMLIGLLCNGHILIEGVPGLAKTLTVKTLAQAIKASFKRIQFTPDLLPADIIGTMIFNQKTSEFIPKQGPVFANFVLTDEINRSPAKVQSALLEAMQEKQVTIGDQTYELPKPFFVLATQNPIEQEGTYPLPEAQIDRFMMKLKVVYTSKADELKILELVGDANFEKLKVKQVIKLEDIIKAQEVANNIYVDKKIKDYIVDIVFATREPAGYGLKDLEKYIELGASPRAGIYLLKAAKANAFLEGRGYVTPEDIKEVGLDVLRHRVILTYEAEAEELTSDDIIQKVFDTIEVP